MTTSGNITVIGDLHNNISSERGTITVTHDTHGYNISNEAGDVVVGHDVQSTSIINVNCGNFTIGHSVQSMPITNIHCKNVAIGHDAHPRPIINMSYPASGYGGILSIGQSLNNAIINLTDSSFLLPADNHIHNVSINFSGGGSSLGLIPQIYNLNGGRIPKCLHPRSQIYDKTVFIKDFDYIYNQIFISPVGNYTYTYTNNGKSGILTITNGTINYIFMNIQITNLPSPFGSLITGIINLNYVTPDQAANIKNGTQLPLPPSHQVYQISYFGVRQPQQPCGSNNDAAPTSISNNTSPSD